MTLNPGQKATGRSVQRNETSQRVAEWVRFYKQSPLKYNLNALIAVLESDGEPMLGAVLRELGLSQSVDLVKDAKK